MHTGQLTPPRPEVAPEPERDAWLFPSRLRMVLVAVAVIAVVGPGLIVAGHFSPGPAARDLSTEIDRSSSTASDGLQDVGADSLWAARSEGRAAVVARGIASGTVIGSGIRSSPSDAPRLAAGGGATGRPTGSGNDAGSTVASIGFSAGDLGELPSTELESRLADMERMGVGWIRLDFSWLSVQHDGAGRFDWEIYDRVVPAIRRHGMNVLALLAHTPDWAATPGCSGGQDCAPRDPGQFADFAAAAVRRYKAQGVRDWEIWNEPNLPASWGPAPNVSRYVALLRATTPAIKSVDPGATVITGGLGVTYTEGQNISARDFLSGVYANGGRPYFDAVAHHPYSYPAEPSSSEDWSGWTQMFQVRQVMVSNADSAKQLWLSEFGAPTRGPGQQATQSDPNWQNHPDHVSEAFQAALTHEAIATHDRYSWMGPMCLYGYQDLGTSTSTKENFFGLVRSDGSHKPAYDVVVSAIAKSSRTTPLAVAG